MYTKLYSVESVQLQFQMSQYKSDIYNLTEFLYLFMYFFTNTSDHRKKKLEHSQNSVLIQLLVIDKVYTQVEPHKK